MSIAPIMLVATKSIPRSITDRRIVPSIPVRIRFNTEHIHMRTVEERVCAETIRSIARYTTAIPNRTHRKALVIVITAV